MSEIRTIIVNDEIDIIATRRALTSLTDRVLRVTGQVESRLNKGVCRCQIKKLS